ncbi:MAG: DUF4381 domain-containing protein [Pseudohongiella sp.]|jgi:hypothetical protein|nr:DUF4381 domain-containing protein [Pseudohongiella sp.]
MDSEELLAQLADIHLPGAISYWPPAPGWWILALLVLAMIVVLVGKYARYRKQKKICQYALAELQHCYDDYGNSASAEADQQRLRYINAFNTVLRRVALVHYPQANVASLAGAAWVDFIREKGDSSLMTEEIAAALNYGRFQTQCEVDVEAMQQLGLQWINSLYQGMQKAASEAQGLHQNA